MVRTSWTNETAGAVSLSGPHRASRARSARSTSSKTARRPTARSRPAERELRRRWGLLRRSSLGARVATLAALGRAAARSSQLRPAEVLGAPHRRELSGRGDRPSLLRVHRVAFSQGRDRRLRRAAATARTDPVTRAQMAVLLLKSKLGSAHIPPPCTGTVFADVPCTGGPFDPWVEELAALQITGGCGRTNYCPGDTVTRQQMAVFLLKAFEARLTSARMHGTFDDVACTPGTGFSADRGVRQPRHHRRLLGRAAPLLSDQSEQPRPDGRVPRQNVRSRTLRG